MLQYKKRRSMSIAAMVGSIIEGLKVRMKNFRAIIIGLVVLVFLLSSCGKAETFVSIVGVVYDSQTNEVLENVTVRFDPDIFTTTSPRGVFELNNIPPGKIQLSFEKEGYRPAVREFELKEGKEFLEVLMERQETVAYTIADQVKLRSQPSVEGEILDALATNTKVALEGSQDKGWYKVKVNDKIGWIWGGYLKSESVTIPRMEVRKDSLLLSSPEEGAQEIQEVYEGYQVIVSENRGEWVKVLLPSGAEGWMPLSVLSP
jgi:hypothetical protein